MQVEQYQARNTQLEREHEHRLAEREALRLEFEHKLDERMRLELKQQELEYEGRIKVQRLSLSTAGRFTCRSWLGKGRSLAAGAEGQSTDGSFEVCRRWWEIVGVVKLLRLRLERPECGLRRQQPRAA